MDEVSIWNYARTEEEIQTYMNTSLNGNEVGLVGYWRLDDGSGQTVTDSTANNNHGYLGASPDPDSEDPTWLSLLVYACPVPDTGQTKCYDNTQEITCPNPGQDFYGQDAQYGPNLQSYTKLDSNGNDLPDEATEWGMVRDNVTGLIWEIKTDDGSVHDKDNLYNWYNAQDVFIATLNSQNFGGYNDWRLPTVKAH